MEWTERSDTMVAKRWKFEARRMNLRLNDISRGWKGTRVIDRTFVADFAIWEAWSIGLNSLIIVVFAKHNSPRIVHRTGRASGPRARRRMTRTFLKDIFLEIVTFTPTSMRSLFSNSAIEYLLNNWLDTSMAAIEYFSPTTFSINSFNLVYQQLQFNEYKVINNWLLDTGYCSLLAIPAMI